MNDVLYKMHNLLLEDKYISKKDYAHILDLCDDEYSYNFDEKVEIHNKIFVKTKLEEYKEYLDKILAKVDKNILLDDEQRNCVLIDEDYCLVVAGAGAGKTTTLAAKVKYLVEKQNIKPEEIIVISYTNKAVKELTEKINKQMGIPAKVITFHSLGYEIMRKDASKMPSILENTYSYFADILMNKVYKEEKQLQNILYFLSYYMNIPEEALNYKNIDEYIEDKKIRDYSTLKGNIERYIETEANKIKKYVQTIKGETLRSIQEVMIANFLYLNNIDYKYEEPYNKRAKLFNKPYMPDFYITQGDKEAYIEHFGMYSKNRLSQIFTPQELGIYEKRMNEKIMLHQKYNTTLIATYPEYEDGKEMLEHLKDDLENCGFTLKSRDYKEVYERLIETSKDKYMHDLIYFITEFISKFKALGMKHEDFNKLRMRTDNVRTKIFIDIVEYVYVEYEDRLREENKIDFNDMINKAIEVVDNIENNNVKLDYKYIIVDEYQDIAKQRFNLTKKLSQVTNSKVIAVGDDWQSIFAFAGSTSEYFLKFKELMGYAEELKITHTYRNSQELIDVAGDFVQKNPMQKKKYLISTKHLKQPIFIYGYEDDKKILDHKVGLLMKVLNKIVKENGEKSSVLLICRYEFEKYQLLFTGKFIARYSKDKIRCNEYPDLDITILTAHRSKGLGFDNVILISAANSKFGFPSQIENDPILNLIEDVPKEPLEFAEERRLFYVALTRTKNRIYILSPMYRPSKFIQELIENYGDNIKSDSRISKKNIELQNKICPICKFPLKFMPKKLKGKIDIWACTNEPEICDFMTNDIKIKQDIHYCDTCEDGCMIIKSKKGDSTSKFWGCTNFKDDYTGCNHKEIIE